VTLGGGEPSILGVNTNFLDQISFVIVICPLLGTVSSMLELYQSMRLPNVVETKKLENLLHSHTV
jgi:hypothetical protein